MLQAGMLIPRYDLSSEWNLRGIFLRHFSWYDRIPPSCGSGFYSRPFAILPLTQTSNQTPITRLQHTIGTADTTHRQLREGVINTTKKIQSRRLLSSVSFFLLSPLCFELNAYLPTYLLLVYPLWYFVGVFQLLGKKNKKRIEKENPINNR